MDMSEFYGVEIIIQENKRQLEKNLLEIVEIDYS